MLKRIALAAFAVAGISAGAQAADMKGPVYKAAPAVFNWNGFYIGGHIGGVWFNGDYVVSGVGPESISGSGFIGGLLAGYNKHFSPNWVIGIEVDGAWSGADATYTSGGPGALRTDLDWNAHVRARLGYAMNRSMLFIAGGLAVARFEQFAPAFGTVSNTVTGYSLGVGLDHAFTPRVIGRIEYLYDDYGTKLYNYAPLGGGTINSSYTTSTVRGSLIWRW
jgi:outer membrane immunogenic protein